MTLHECKIGGTVRVKKLGGNGELRQHFLDMGIIPGTEITLIKYAPLGDSFRNAVKHERQVELAFEDHRYWDLLRWKDAMTVLNSPVQGVKITRSGDTYTYKVVDVADRTFAARNYYLPLMRSEIENSAGTLEQNPGY